MSTTNTDTSTPFYVTFSEEFRCRYSEIRVSIDSPEAVSQDQLQKDVAALSKFLSDSLEGIPSYDQKRYYSVSTTCSTGIAPHSRGNRRFAFKRKPAAAGSTSIPPLATSASLPNTSSDVTRVDTQGVSNQVMTLSSLALPNSRTLTLSNISKSLLDFTQSPAEDASPSLSSVHLKSLSSCVAIFPPIDGSMTLHSLEQCTLVVSCHQLRIHDSKDVTIYLDLPTPDSVPILEHCTNLRFGRHPSSTLSQYTYVPQDFSNILASGTKNWEFLPVDNLPDLTSLKSAEGCSPMALESLLNQHLPSIR
jgi:hypothetical protein